ncbi:MAG: hypothetical protein EXX96DRAFT_482672, partial [Benjaminiella poitrasii]
ILFLIWKAYWQFVINGVPFLQDTILRNIRRPFSLLTLPIESSTSLYLNFKQNKKKPTDYIAILLTYPKALLILFYDLQVVLLTKCPHFP